MRLLVAVALSLAAAACSQNSNVVVTIAPVTDPPVFHCRGVPADSSTPCGHGSWSVTAYEPLTLDASEPGGSDGQVLRVIASSPTDKASACLLHYSGGFLSGPSTVECADSGMLTLSVFPMTSADGSPSGMTHLHFPDGATIDSTF